MVLLLCVSHVVDGLRRNDAKLELSKASQTTEAELLKASEPAGLKKGSIALGIQALSSNEVISNVVEPFANRIPANVSGPKWGKPHGLGDAWGLFHKVAAVVASSDLDISATEVIAFVYVSVRAGLECQACRAHFLDAFEMGAYGVGTILQDEDPLTQKQNVVMWLWRVHNAVTVFRSIMGNHTKDLRWPSFEECPACWKAQPDGTPAAAAMEGGEMDRDRRGKLGPECWTSVVDGLSAKGTWSEADKLGVLGSGAGGFTKINFGGFGKADKFSAFGKEADFTGFGQSPKKKMTFDWSGGGAKLEPSNEEVYAVLEDAYDMGQVYQYLIDVYS